MRLLGIIGVLIMCSQAVGQPSTRPSAPDYVVSATRVQQTQPATIFFRELEASFATFDQVAKPVDAQMRAVVRENGIRVSGPAMMVYTNLPTDRETVFKFQFGVTVEPGTKPVGEFKVRELPPIRCRSILYAGHVRNVTNAFRRLMADVSATGEELAGEIRELALFWEGDESDNNVIQLQVAVK